jgi:hypothetical protein
VRAGAGAALRRAAVPAVLACAAACSPGAAAAQFARPAGVSHPAADSAAAERGVVPEAIPGVRTVERSADRTHDAPWWTPAASAVVPGAGQAAMGQDRFVAYLAVESYGWVKYLADVAEGRRERRSYRSLADRVARTFFSVNRPKGDFEYYERMEHYLESGVYDADPGGDLQPEQNVGTFNGALWLQARQTFWESPDTPPPVSSDAYQRAIAFYEQRAIRPDFRWSWRDAQLEQDLYRRAISRSNAAFRRSGQELAVILANHALSTVDAYVTVRIRRHATVGEAYRLELQLPWPRGF